MALDLNTFLINLVIHLIFNAIILTVSGGFLGGYLQAKIKRNLLMRSGSPFSGQS